MKTDPKEQALFKAWQAASRAYAAHPGTRATVVSERLWQDYIAATNALKAYQATKDLTQAGTSAHT